MKQSFSIDRGKEGMKPSSTSTILSSFFALLLMVLISVNPVSAEQYESEFNDTKATATSIAYGDLVVGDLWHALDYDWYKVNIPSAGLVSLTAYYEFPDGATAVPDAMFLELRTEDNRILSDFYIDYENAEPPYIRDINIPSSGNYYIVIYCANNANYQRDRYYFSFAGGAGERADVRILNEEDSVFVTADGESTASLTAKVIDSDEKPVVGALVVFSTREGQDNLFSQANINTNGNSDPFYLTSGSKDISVSFTNTQYGSISTVDGVVTDRVALPSYFRTYLVDQSNSENIIELYSVTTEGVVSESVVKNIISDGQYYLVVEVNGNGIWEVSIPNDNESVSREIGSAITDSDGFANFTYKSSEIKGDIYVVAAFGNASDTFKIEQTADTPAKIDLLGLLDEVDENTTYIDLEDSDSPLFINREYTLQVSIKDKNNNFVEDEYEPGKPTQVRITSSLDNVTKTRLQFEESVVNTKDGFAEFKFSASRNIEYSVTVTLEEDSTISDSLTLNFNSINMNNMLARPAYVLADGETETLVSVRLSDENGKAVKGEPVDFSSTCGSLIQDSAVSDDNGIAQVALMSPYIPGICTVTAAYGTLKRIADVLYYGDGSGSTTASISLVSNVDKVPANGTNSIVLTASLFDSAGAGVAAGTPIHFETTHGRFLNGEKVFNAAMQVGGTVNVALLTVAEETGRATITCTSGGISQSTQVLFTAVGPDGTPIEDQTAFINLSAAPVAISADGKSSLMITAELKNTMDSPVPAGTEIAFYASSGLFSNGAEIDGEAQFTAATTDESGKVNVALISSTTPGPVDVWCLSNGVYQLTTVTFTDTDAGATSIGYIALSAEPAAIPADGMSSTAISAILTDAVGAPVPAGVSITFSTNIGRFSNDTQSITTATSDESGKVIVPLIASSTSGLAQVTATSGGVTQNTLVTFEGEEVAAGTANIALSADPTQIPADGESSLTVTAVLTDSTGTPVAAGTSLTFKTSSGIFQNDSDEYTLSTSDDSGSVSVSLISSIAAGSADITCTSNGVTQLTTVLFTGPSTGVGETTSISLSASPATITADGVSSTTITISLTDSTGAPVNTGTEATLTTTLGTLSQTTVSTVDESGTISVALTAGTEAGTARVVCTSNGITQAINVIFTGGSSADQTPAQLALSLSQISVKTDNSDSTTVTAIVLDANYSVIEGIPVSFTADGGQLSSSLVETDADGQAQVIFSSGTTDQSNAIINITADVPGLDPEVIPVQVIGSTVTLTDTGTDLILDDSATGENESNSSTLTITAQDASGNPVYNTQISIASTGASGALQWKFDGDPNFTNPGTAQTNINGQVVIVVKGVLAGSPEITVQGLGAMATKTFTVGQLADSFGIVLPENDLTNVSTKDAVSLEITGPMTSLAFNDTNPDTIVRSDGGDFTTENYVIGDQIMVGGSADNDGRYTIATVAATTLTLEASDALTAEATGENVTLTNSVLVRVRAPNQTQVRFATTIGQIDGEGVQVKTVNVDVNGFASVVVSSELAGVATVEVSDIDNPNTVDRVSIAFSRPSAEAATITLQSNTAAISPSVGDNKSIAEFTAYVKTSGDTGNQAVADVPVIFSIENSTGSGESVSPVIVYTNAAGEAKTIFTAGTLGSDAEGVTVTARVVGSATTDYQTDISFVVPRTIHRVAGSFVVDNFKPGQQIRVDGSNNNNDGYYTIDSVTATDLILDAGDTVVAEGAGANVLITALTHSTNIVIGGTSGSVVIGRGAGDSIIILNPTTYSLYMSVLVSDLNGNPVSGADVSLNLWPIQYNTGVWFDLNDRVSDHYVPYISGSFANEDINENTFLDPGEDTNRDAILTPPNSASGNIPTLLTTDENGLAEFNIIYLKSSAVWIGARIRASTMVFGTETKASMEFTLPAEKIEAEAGYLPDSAYPYVLICSSGGTASFLLKPFAGDSYDTFTSLLSDVTITGVSGGVDTDGDGTVDTYSSYRYDYTDPGLPSGRIRYDSVTVTDVACSATFPVKIIIE